MATIIITGASRGIGFELCRLFSRDDHEVWALSRNTKPLTEAGLKGVTPVAFDISREADIAAFQNRLKDSGVLIDILIHNAGSLINKAFMDTSLSEFEAVYAVNVFGVARLTQAVIPFMDARGHVVTISSMGGVQGSAKFPGLSAYSSSKGAVITLSELLAEEYKETGPAFNVLALGAVQTEMLAEAFPGYQAPLSAGEMARYIKNFALEGHRWYNGKILPVSKSTP